MSFVRSDDEAALASCSSSTLSFGRTTNFSNPSQGRRSAASQLLEGKRIDPRTVPRRSAGDHAGDIVGATVRVSRLD
jgi:hypothetical protein